MSDSVFDFDNEPDEIDRAIESVLDSAKADEIVAATVASKMGNSIIVEIDGLDEVIYETSSAYEPGVKVSNIRSQYDALMAVLAVVDNEKQAIQDEIDAIRREATAKIRLLQDKLDGINENARASRTRKYDLERELREQTNALRQALANERVKSDLRAKAIAFDDITAGLFWREFAFPHQIDGGKFLAAAKRAILGDTMGLGKSLTSLIASDMLQAQKVLIIVPDDVVSNFVNEIYRWAPHRTVVMLGKQTKMGRALAVKALTMLDSFTVVLNYSAWRRDSNLLRSLVNCRFDTVIMDEAHTIKTTSTNAYKGCKEIVLADNSCPKCRGHIQRYKSSQGWNTTYWGCSGEVMVTEQWDLAIRPEDAPVKTNGCGWNDLDTPVNDYGVLRSVVNVFPMTGTVILNKPRDIFALLSLIDPQNFHNANEFERVYCERDYYTGKYNFKPGGMASLMKRLDGKYIARDRKSAGIKLPKQTVQVHNLELDPAAYPKQYKVIKDLSRHAMILLESGKNLPILHAIALITRKRQANVWPAGIEFKDEDGNVLFSVRDDVTESIKIDTIIDTSDKEDGPTGLIPDMTANGDMELGERVVLFSQFKAPLNEIQRRCDEVGISCVVFNGDTPQKIRDEIKVDFDRKMLVDGRKPKWQVVLCHYKTGGVGLNFTDATQMIILDEEWNPGKETQAYARVDRMGQTEETTVHVLRIANSIDDWLADLIAQKRDMIEGFNSNTAGLMSGLLDGMRGGEVL